MKTTLDINDTLLASAKALAAQQRSSLTRFIEEGLQLRLRAGATSRSAGEQRAPVIPVYGVKGRGKGGLVAGLDPSSNKALLEAVDGDTSR